jgi:hypothetical protein
MQDNPVQRGIAASAFSLLAFGVCLAAFLPPFLSRTLQSLPMTILASLGIAASCILHFCFVGITAQRMGRSPGSWVALAIVSFPLGSIVGLIMLGWFNDEKAQAAAQDH